MSEITRIGLRDVYHQPHLMGETVHRIEKVIEAAAALQRWDDLEKAIDFLIECQQVILQWWKNHVRERGGGPSSRDPEKLSNKAAQDEIGLDDSRLSRWREAHKNLDTYREQVGTAARRKAELEAAPNHRAEGTGENEWFTPPMYIAAAREVLGGIDLDPATHPRAQETIQAAAYFTRDDSGLAHDWYGRVWLNPPYAQPAIEHFVVKLVGEYTACRVIAAIMLTHNYTDTAWFHLAARAASLLCFTKGRIRFVDIDGASCSPTQGQCFFYFGDRADRFHQHFGQFGFIT